MALDLGLDTRRLGFRVGGMVSDCHYSHVVLNA